MNLPFLPAARPRKRREDVAALALRAGLSPVQLRGVYLLAIRGYYHDKHSDNERGIYDDAIFLVSPDMFVPFNANTDPSIFRTGIATLRPGIHPFRVGWHKKGKPGGHRALRPATKGEELPVRRDGVNNPRPGVAINIHRGGRNGTSSEGCQTIPPAQHDAFQSLVEQELKRHRQEIIPYVLTE